MAVNSRIGYFTSEVIVMCTGGAWSEVLALPGIKTLASYIMNYFIHHSNF